LWRGAGNVRPSPRSGLANLAPPRCHDSPRRGDVSISPMVEADEAWGVRLRAGRGVAWRSTRTSWNPRIGTRLGMGVFPSPAGACFAGTLGTCGAFVPAGLPAANRQDRAVRQILCAHQLVAGDRAHRRQVPGDARPIAVPGGPPAANAVATN